MTSPIGTPDDQVQTNAAADPYANGSFAAPVGNTVIASGPCGSMPAISVLADTITSGVQVNFLFFSDPLFGNQTGAWTLNLGGSSISRAIGPILGNYFQVNLHNATAGAATVVVRATPVNVQVARVVNLSDQNYISSGLTSVPASGTVTLMLPQVQAGQCWFWFSPADATGHLTANVVADAGYAAFGGPAFIASNPVAEVDRILGLPDLPMGVSVVNNDGAAAHSFRLALIPTGDT